VYIEQEDIDAAIYMSKYCTSDYTYVDNNGNIRNQIEFTDYFRLPAKKYFGIYKNIPTVSVSTDYYLISASVLSQAKDITSRKGATICDLDYPTIPLDTRWRSISNAN
jgi:hypothetical protein